MTLTPTIPLQTVYADALPELAKPWQAVEHPEPRLLLLNEPLADKLGLDADYLRTDEGVRLLVGNHVPSGAAPVAQAYAGHQFGHYNPRLGDGRALLLGEVHDREGGLRDVHLKGSGRTPFARGGDGLAAVGPMLREYVVSEAMHALGIPTTRSLAVTATGSAVHRESLLPGAVLTRVAASHLRVGTFQYVRATGDVEPLRRLANHAIERHYSDAASAERPALALLDAVVAAQASLIAQWMTVGFIHGVMNTDNMTISGESIDYGPCAFMEGFDPATVYSSIDHAGRYAYGNQPPIASWNLARLAEALLPLIDDDEQKAIELATESVTAFQKTYGDHWTEAMRAKLGLPAALESETVVALSTDVLALMQGSRADHTLFFRHLAQAARGDAEPVRGMFLDLPEIDAWLERWRAHSPDPDAMGRVNPMYLPRNHLVEEALEAGSAGDLEPVRRLLEAVTRPYDVRPGLERYAEPAPEEFGRGYQTFCGT